MIHLIIIITLQLLPIAHRVKLSALEGSVSSTKELEGIAERVEKLDSALQGKMSMEVGEAASAVNAEVSSPALPVTGQDALG